jgi:hypothetical protein
MLYSETVFWRACKVLQAVAGRLTPDVSRLIRCHFDIKGCDQELMLLKSSIGVVGNFAFN